MDVSSHVNKRMRYVAGAVVGALAATGLVVLGASLGDGRTAQEVELTGDESAVDETTSSTDETTTTLAPPTPAEMPERVVIVEQRVTEVEQRVSVLEATTTTNPYVICAEGTARAGERKLWTDCGSPADDGTFGCYSGSTRTGDCTSAPPVPGPTPNPGPAMSSTSSTMPSTTTTTMAAPERWSWYSAVEGGPERTVQIYLQRWREDPPMWPPPSSLQVRIVTTRSRTFEMTLGLVSNTTGQNPSYGGIVRAAALDAGEDVADVTLPGYEEHRQQPYPVIQY